MSIKRRDGESRPNRWQANFLWFLKYLFIYNLSFKIPSRVHRNGRHRESLYLYWSWLVVSGINSCNIHNISSRYQSDQNNKHATSYKPQGSVPHLLKRDRCFNGTDQQWIWGHIGGHIQLKILPILDRGIFPDKRQFPLIYTVITPSSRLESHKNSFCLPIAEFVLVSCRLESWTYWCQSFNWREKLSYLLLSPPRFHVPSKGRNIDISTAAVQKCLKCILESLLLHLMSFCLVHYN